MIPVRPSKRPGPVVTDVRSATEGEWDATVDACPHATFFHTREWAQVWQEHSGGTLAPAARLATFDDGFTALLPSVEKTILDLTRVGRIAPAFRTVISSYASTYGGWVSGDPLTPAHHQALWERIEGLNLDLTQNPFDEALAAAELPWTRRSFTQVVDLEPEFDEIRRRWSRGHVSAVNKATRAGLEAVEARTEEQWLDYLRVYELSLKRWGEPTFRYGDDLFRTLARSTSGKIRLWVVEYDGGVIVGAICVYQGDTVVYWHGATDTSYQHLRAAPLLHAQIMRHAKEAGYRWYDFNPSGPDQAGVITFKERFGAVRRDVHSVVSDARLKRSLRSARAIAVRVRGSERNAGKL